MASVKHDRIQEQIKEVASQIILFRLKDPRLGFITITKVDLSLDLRVAKIYYSVLGTDIDTKLTAQAMGHARGHIQREVAKHIHLRFAPEIRFELDDTPRKSIELSKLIDQAIAEDEQRKKETHRDQPEGAGGDGETGGGGEEKTGDGETRKPEDMLDKADELRAKADELRGKGMEDQAVALDDQADELEDQAGDLEGKADELEDEAADVEGEADELEDEADEPDDEEEGRARERS